MRWIEAAVPAADQDMDALCLRLEAQGAEGFVIEDEADFRQFLENNRRYWDYVDEALYDRFKGVSRVKFYLPDDGAGWAVLESIRKNLGLSPQIAFIEDSDWENSWREYYTPLPIGERLLVVPRWLDPDPGGRVPLRLDPGLIFGTGSHATTRMCLCETEKYAAPGVRVLDLGCGSGILGIAALLLGCAFSAGCDVDSKAPDVACANAALNGIGKDRFRVLAGDILVDAVLRRELGSGYGLVLANIVADVIIPLAGLVPAFLAPGGVLVCSGIIEGRQGEVEGALEDAGFEIVSHRCEEDWHCFAAKQGGAR